jgi:hypothetical protein
MAEKVLNFTPIVKEVSKKKWLYTPKECLVKDKVGNIFKNAPA